MTSTDNDRLWVSAVAALPTLLVAVLAPLPAAAQAQAPACTLQQAAFPSRQVLRCRDGLSIEAEAGADYTLVDQDRDGSPDAVELRGRALFVDGPARPGGRGFRVLTPQAIAAVRGTQWVVDVAGAKTAVFVVTGHVSVRRPAVAREVNLGPGEGVDVEAGATPLVVRRWPVARASALLARFGR